MERRLSFHQDSLHSGPRLPLLYSVSAFWCFLYRLRVGLCSWPCCLTQFSYLVMAQTLLAKQCWRTIFVFLMGCSDKLSFSGVTIFLYIGIMQSVMFFEILTPLLHVSKKRQNPGGLWPYSESVSCWYMKLDKQ